MEHDDQPLPIDIRKLGRLAEKCRVYAKALHYKEIEFQMRPSATIEALISINNQLGQPEAARGILLFAQQQGDVHLQASWFEKLYRWEDALAAYDALSRTSVDVINGKMRSLHALGEWERLAGSSSLFWLASFLFAWRVWWWLFWGWLVGWPRRAI